MNSALPAIVMVALFANPVCGAFELTRSIVPATPSYDPLAPASQFWLLNPATLAFSAPHASFGYANPYRVRELAAGMAGCALRVKRISFALSATLLGEHDYYREADLAFTTATRIGGRTALAATGHYLELRFGPRFAPAHLTALDLGVWHEFPRGIGVGLSASDLLAASVGGRPAVPALVRLQATYRYSPVLALRTGLQRRDRWVFTLGETLLLTEQLLLRADLLTSPLRLTVGGRIRFRGAYLDITYRDHPELGGDQIVGLGWEF